MICETYVLTIKVWFMLLAQKILTTTFCLKGRQNEILQDMNTKMYFFDTYSTETRQLTGELN